MRELGGTLFSPERRKVSLKVNNGKEESSEGRRRLSNGGYSSTPGNYGTAGKPNGFSSGSGSSLPRMKNGSSSIPMVNGNGNGNSRHPNSELTFEHSPLVSPENENSSKRKIDDGMLPQWGHGKRSRCNRFELSKHASLPADEPASKSAPSVDKKPSPSSCGPVTASKLRGHVSSKSISSKGVKDDASLQRNGFINRTANGFAHKENGLQNTDSLKRSSEGKDRALSKDRLSPQHNKVSVDQRQHQRNDGSELATTTHGHGHHVHGNGNATENHHRNGTFVSSDYAAGPINYKPTVNLQNMEWPRIMITLTRKEKEDDFLIFKGSKLPQRPKKRPKLVEKALLYCTPGTWLSDLTRGRYDVREKKNTKKKPRGLKAMESMESDSE